ncbi:MAG: hypothetical protein V3S89_06295 [Desulfobacterales bacterium]
MTRCESNSDYQSYYEYHGNTTIEITRKRGGITVKHDWLLFDTVEEAQDFFHDSDCDDRMYYVQ